MSRMTFSRRASRWASVLVAALLLVTALALAAPQAGGQPSPSPSPSPSGSASPSPSTSPGGNGEFGITLLNPNAAYDATPKISDRFDGVDSRYTILARSTGEAESVIVEAAVAPQNPNTGEFENEITIGELERVSSGSDVWQLDWDIPSTMPEGTARFVVRAFVESAEGFVEAGSDEVEVSISYSDTSPPPVGSYDTVALLWPDQEGPLGFYKPRVGAWRVVVDGRTSPGATHVQMFVSTSRPGEEITFVPCGSVRTVPGDPFDTFTARCTLVATALPSQVTALAALAEFRQEESGTRFPQAADVRVVKSYDLEPHDMNVVITPGWGRFPAPATACHTFKVFVTDEFGRPVLGANVDVHATGPTDELILFGNGLAVPESHSVETTRACPGGLPVPTNPRPQADHNVPGGVDSKHLESSQGTGLDLPDQPAGEISFAVASERAGITNLLAWVDDQPISRETDQRAADDDHLDPEESLAEARLQWLPAPMTVSLDPVGGTAPAETCFPYVVKARSGTAPLPGINVDVHATGPTDDLDFCDPPGAVERRAPAVGAGANAHQAEEPSESHHLNPDAADAQHTEGETDAAGNFVVGLTSPAVGDTSVVAWIDGETGADDDEQRFGEAVTSGTINWASSTGEAELSFLNPSQYGGFGSASTAGSGNGTQVPDSGGVFEILVRVDMAAHVPGVEVLLSRDNRQSYTLLGEAERVGQTDVYRLAWPVDLPDGMYGLRARIEGSAVVEDVDVKVGAGDLLPMVPNPPYESLRIERPLVAAGVPFTRRATVVSGSATAGAEGVDVFYTKVPSKDTPGGGDWIFCGYADLSGTGTSRQAFGTLCTLTGSDQAEQVTGIAAITYDCAAGADGCDANPNPPPPAEGGPAPQRLPGQKETGQALRVFGYEANPLLAVEPAETEAVTGSCRRLEVALRDQTGQPLGDENVDLHLDGGRFCRPPDASGLRAPVDGGHGEASEDPALQLEAPHEGAGAPTWHTEGETLPDGSLVFGVTAEDEGDARITAWLDRDDDDVQGVAEIADVSLVHWVPPQGCTIVGSPGPDVLSGTAGPDVFCGLEGNDVIRGRGGADTAFGGAGRDRLYGGRGRDLLRGARGRDLLKGGPGRDTCRGGPGRDRIVRCELPRPKAVAARRSGV